MLAKQQHYVPRFLLKNFTTGKKPLVWVFDKHTSTSFRTNITNIAAENGFYNLEDKDSILTLEPGLAHLEDRASSVISELIRLKTLKGISDESRIVLAYFLAVQFVRTKEHRLTIEALQEAVTTHLKKMGATDEDIQKFIGPSDHHTAKIMSLRSIAGAKDLAPHFLAKTWMLLETRKYAPLYISDNPITLHNRRDHAWRGNLGLSVPGIEIYFPISSTVCLGLICPTIGEEISKAHENFKTLDRLDPMIANQILKDPAGAREFCNGVINGTPLLLHRENVTMLNSLQVTFSSRFIYCEEANFELPNTMIRDNPKFREGLKPAVG